MTNLDRNAGQMLYSNLRFNVHRCVNQRLDRFEHARLIYRLLNPLNKSVRNNLGSRLYNVLRYGAIR